MRIAIPITGGKLSTHFGHCEEFALVDVDDAKNVIVKKQVVEAPQHEPGLLPRWLAEQGVSAVIASGMGMRAQGLFAAQNIRVAVGVPAEDPEALALAYVNGTLQDGPNICDH